MQEAGRIRRPLVVSASVALVFALALPAAEGAWQGGAGGPHAARARSAAPVHAGTLDRRLARVRATLATVTARSDALDRQRAELAVQRRIARQALARARVRLAERIRALYEAGDTKPLDAILGAASLDEALARLDSVERAAAQDAFLIRQARALRSRVAQLRRTLDDRQRQLDRLQRSTRVTLAALERLQWEQTADASRGATSRPTASGPERAAPDAPARVVIPAAPAVASGERTLTVVATAYALPGTTATGTLVEYGTVAVDPAVIPFGSELSIPGYGDGVAADTGPAVRGARIDVWLPTVQAALAWGTRTVTVTIREP